MWWIEERRCGPPHRMSFPMQLRVRTEIKQKSEREPHHRGNPEPVLIICR